MSVQITILGLGQVGAAIGQALGKSKDQVVRIGSDSRPDVAGRAQKLGLIDKNVFNIPDAVAKADAVILAVPADELRLTMEAIAADLKPGVVVLDTSSTPTQFIALAKELFPPEDRYVLTFTPALNPAYLNDVESGPDASRVDLFENSVIFISNPIGVDASAIQFAENLARLLGATPIFADSVEVDGLLSSSRLMPSLVAAAVARATIGKPGWLEARKLAGASYAHVTQPLKLIDTSKDLSHAAITQRVSVLNGIDVLIEELNQMRDLIEAGDVEKLSALLEQVQNQRDGWLHQRTTSKWEDTMEKQPPIPTFGETIGRLIGLRPRSERNQRK